jgi:hypothetical protein
MVGAYLRASCLFDAGCSDVGVINDEAVAQITAPELAVFSWAKRWFGGRRLVASLGFAPESIPVATSLQAALTCSWANQPPTMQRRSVVDTVGQ